VIENIVVSLLLQIGHAKRQQLSQHGKPNIISIIVDQKQRVQNMHAVLRIRGETGRIFAVLDELLDEGSFVSGSQAQKAIGIYDLLLRAFVFAHQSEADLR